MITQFKDSLNSYLILTINSFLLLIIYYLFYSYGNSFTTENAASISIVFLCILFVSFSTITTKIAKTKIIVSFFFIRKTIDVSDIISISVVKINALKKFKGIGYRLNFNNEVGFVLSSGNCLKIQTKTKTYYISFKNKYISSILADKNFQIKDESKID